MVAHCCENRGYVWSYGVDLLLGFLLYFGYVLLLAWMECADQIGTVVETAASNVQTFCAGAVLYQVCRLSFFRTWIWMPDCCRLDIRGSCSW